MKSVISKKEIIYLVSVTIYMLCTLVLLTVPGESILASNAMLRVLKLLRYISYFLVMVKSLLEFFSKSTLSNIALVGVVALLNIAGSKDKVTLFFLLFIITAREIKKESIIATTTICQVVVLAVTICLCYMNVIPDYVFYEGDRTRHSLGFTWTTTPAILFFFITLECIYLRKSCITVVEYVLLFVGNTFFYLQTKTRVTYFLICIILLFFFLYQRVKLVKKIILSLKGIYPFVPAVVCLGSILLHCLYRPDIRIWNKLNNFLNGRLVLGANAYKQYGVTLFGQPIEWIGNSYHGIKGVYNYVDCSYVQILLEQGVIFLILVVALYSMLIWNSIQNENYYLCGILLFIVIFSITEPRLFNIGFNPILLCAGDLFKDGGTKCELLERKE